MTIADVIHEAQFWQEVGEQPNDAIAQRTHRFTYTIVMLDAERQAAMQLLADFGATGDTLCDRIKALAASRGGKQ